MPDLSRKDQKDLLKRLRRDYKLCVDDVQEMQNRKNAVLDLKFINVPGFQWDEWTKAARGQDRPMYEFNRLRITIKRIVNDMRANRPQGKVRGVEDDDKDTAEVYEGLCRNIWNVSDGDSVIDTAAEYQVGGGMGVWQFTTQYSTDEAFDQDIIVKGFKNPFCVFAGPCQDQMKRDAPFWIVTEKVTKAQFEEKYPKAKSVSFEDDSGLDDKADWEDEDGVRLAEYWYKEPVIKQLCLLSDGATVEKTEGYQLPEGVTIVRERTVNSYQIYSAVCSGDSVLQGPTPWAGSMFPFVMVYGEYVVIEGKVYWFGITRHAKDAQRSYNYARTSIIETIASAPQAKVWATVDQAKNLTDSWSEANKKNFFFALYNADPKVPGPPQRVGGADVPVALLQEAQIGAEEIKANTGIFDNSLGQHANESSGIAIRARAQQGEIATFNYADNIAKGIRRSWEIMIDLIPKIYDTTRAVRILGADGGEKYVKVNHADPVTGEVENDVTRGKYDVAITVGPSFATQRQEAVDAFTSLAQSDEGLMASSADLVYKAMDLPYSDQIAERRKMLLPPQIQQAMQDGKDTSPEVQAALAQASQAMAAVQQQGQLVQQAAQEAQQERADADKAKADVQVAQANLKAQAAQLQAQEAKLNEQAMKAMCDLMKQEMAMKDSQGMQDMEGERQALATQVQEAIAMIQQQAAEFMKQSAEFLAQLQANSAPATKKQVRIKRVNGELVGEIADTPAMA